MSNFCTVVLTSTRQHWGLTDIDKVSINDTLSKSDLIQHSYKLAHIKIIPGEESIAENKRKWFENKGFEVIDTIGDWKNDDNSHGSGIINDMANVYNRPEILNKDYIFHLENDWVFETANLDDYLYQSIAVLSNFPEIIYHRQTRVDRNNTIKELDGIGIANNIWLTNREFSFNPFVSRSRDMRYIAPFVARNNIHPHCEMAYELAAKYLTGKKDIFSFTDSRIVRHVGDIHDKEWYENKLKELNGN